MAYPIFHSQYTAAQIEALISNPPRINPITSEWEVWDIDAGEYSGTGVIAESAEYAAQAKASEELASAYQEAASDASIDAEAWSVGTRSGDPVAPDDPAYHNNSKYYAEKYQQSAFVTEDVSGDPATIDDGADDIPIKRINSIDIVAGQSGSGTPSPSNIREIYGWTAANISAYGAGPLGPVQTREITFPGAAGTVYGGTLTYLGGTSWQISVTHGIRDMSAYGWDTYGSGGKFYQDLPTTGENAAKGLVVGGHTSLCNIYDRYVPTANGWIFSLPDNSFCACGSNNGVSNVLRIWLYDSSKAGYTAAQFKAFMADIDGNGTHGYYTYELATPKTYDFTATVEEISTVLGQNYFSADCGEINLTYRADTKLYINKMLGL